MCAGMFQRVCGLGSGARLRIRARKTQRWIKQSTVRVHTSHFFSCSHSYSLSLDEKRRNPIRNSAALCHFGCFPPAFYLNVPYAFFVFKPAISEYAPRISAWDHIWSRRSEKWGTEKKFSWGRLKAIGKFKPFYLEPVIDVTSSRIAGIPSLKSRTSISPTSDLKRFQAVSLLCNQSASPYSCDRRKLLFNKHRRRCGGGRRSK